MTRSYPDSPTDRSPSPLVAVLLLIFASYVALAVVLAVVLGALLVAGSVGLVLVVVGLAWVFREVFR